LPDAAGAMARPVYFIFSPEHDAARAAVIRRAWKRRGGVSTGLSPDDAEPAAARNRGTRSARFARHLSRADAAVVLIGGATAESPAVRDAVTASLACRTPLIGVAIHRIPDARGLMEMPGPNPFDYFAITRHGRQAGVRYLRWTRSMWLKIPGLADDPSPPPPYRDLRSWAKLSALVPTYDWVGHKGEANLASWVELAFWRARA